VPVSARAVVAPWRRVGPGEIRVSLEIAIGFQLAQTGVLENEKEQFFTNRRIPLRQIPGSRTITMAPGMPTSVSAHHYSGTGLSSGAPGCCDGRPTPLHDR
jgi:hypothetical protein